jgi:hypothetical protein
VLSVENTHFIGMGPLQTILIYIRIMNVKVVALLGK